MSEIAIKIEGLSKLYQIGSSKSGSFKETFSSIFKKERQEKETSEFWALKDVSFEIKRGEAVGIVGRNGAGKSTLLKILSRITDPTAGRIEINGRVSSLLEVGTGFHPELTGRENVFLNGTILGMTRKEVKAKFDEIVEFSGVQKFIDTPVKHYSSGMYVRLAFAVAAHLEPEILIIDEVLAVGDAEFQKKCLGKMNEVAGQGRTVLFVSHNIPAIQNLCTECVVLGEGKVVFPIGDTESALQFYRNSITPLNNLNDLKDNKNRSGKGNLRFTSINFFNKLGDRIYAPVCGELLKIVLEAESKEKINNVSISIGFYSLGGECKLILWTELINRNLNVEVGKNIFECTVDKFPLSKGLYSINIFSSSNPDILDWVQEACSFEVEDGDFYNTGKNIQSNHQTVLIPHNWR